MFMFFDLSGEVSYFEFISPILLDEFKFSNKSFGIVLGGRVPSKLYSSSFSAFFGLCKL